MFTLLMYNNYTFNFKLPTHAYSAYKLQIGIDSNKLSVSSTNLTEFT